MEAGAYYSTVGVSDEWSTARAWGLLKEFGPFDEISVGRNWLNTGVKRFVTDLAGEAVVPQVVVIAEDVRVDTLPFVYGKPVELLRVVGVDGMRAWASAGFLVSLSNVMSKRSSQATVRGGK
jgi:hypothetical protein